MNHFVFTTLFILFSTSCSYNAHNDGKDLIYKSNSIYKANTIVNHKIEIPSELNLYIEKNLVDYSIPDTSIFINEWKLFYDDSLSLPYFISGDFNNDKLTDYSLLLKNKKENELILVAFNRKSDTDFSHYILDTIIYNENKVSVGIYLQKKGIIEGIDGSLELKYNAIVLSYFETSSSVFYWKDNNYINFSLGD